MPFFGGYPYTSHRNINVKDGIVRFGGTLSAHLDTTSNASDRAIYVRDVSGIGVAYFWDKTTAVAIGRVNPALLKYLTTTTTLTATESGYIIVGSSVGGSMFLTLPKAATQGLTYTIVNDSANAATGDLFVFDYNGPRTASGNYEWIAGSAGTYTALRARGRSITLVADGGTAWIAVASHN